MFPLSPLFFKILKINNMYNHSYQTDNPYCIDAKGKMVYQSGNDAMNPNGLKRYFVKGCEIWAYSRKDAVMKQKAGLIHKAY